MILDSFKTVAKNFMGGLKSGAKDQLKSYLEDAKDNLKNRSPAAAWLVKTASEEYKKIKDENNSYAKKYDTFVEQDAPQAESLKAEIQKNSSKELSPKKLEKETRNTLRQLEESFKKDPKAAAESELYKRHQTAFDSYKKFADKEDTEANGKTIPRPESKPSDKKSDKISAKLSADGKVLEAIRDNTEETVEILKDGSPENKPNGTIKSALNSTSGNLISKVFNEKTIEHYAEKIKETLGMPPGEDLKDIADKDSEAKEEQIEAKESDNKEVVDELKKINKFLENDSDREEKEENQDDLIEARKSEADQIEDNLREKLTVGNQSVEKEKSVSDRLKAKSLDENNPLNDVKEKIKNRILDPAGNKTLDAARGKGYIPTTEGPRKIAGGRFTEPARKAGQVVGKASRAVGQATSKAGSVVSSGARAVAASAGGKALGVGALVAGGLAAAYGVGTLLSKGIDSGISSLTGKETSLGGWIHDKVNGNENLPEVTPSSTAKTSIESGVTPNTPEAVKPTTTAAEPLVAAPNTPAEPTVTAAPNTPVPAAEPTVTAAYTSPVSMVEKQLNRSDTIAAEKEEKNSQPIVINAGSTINKSSTGGAPAVVASPIRNTESTYERVQMQDFWPRAK